MSLLIRKVWEVYERDTQRCIAFASEELAENQNVFSEVDCCGWSNVLVTEEESNTLDKGNYIW